MSVNSLIAPAQEYCANGRPWSLADGAAGPRVRGWYAPCRAVVEFVAALGLFVATVPLTLAAIVLVKMSSRGPAFYLQVRMGRAGRPYTMYKIRSMYNDCERLSGPCWSTGRDPRVTPVGRVLRRTHIDELPQLWNVLRGEMSLIGPRPERPEFAPKLEQAFPCYGRRLRVRPGVTGLAQVQLPPDFDMESVRNKLAYDLYYIEKLGPLLDLRILLGTALKLIGVPFTALRTIVAMPTRSDVETVYRRVASPLANERSQLEVQPV